MYLKSLFYFIPGETSPAVLESASFSLSKCHNKSVSKCWITGIKCTWWKWNDCGYVWSFHWFKFFLWFFLLLFFPPLVLIHLHQVCFQKCYFSSQFINNGDILFTSYLQSSTVPLSFSCLEGTLAPLSPFFSSLKPPTGNNNNNNPTNMSFY